MKIAVSILVVLSLCPRVAAAWPSCSEVPECPLEDKDKGWEKVGEKGCCDARTKLVWQRDGCKAEMWSVLSGDPETTGPFVIRFRWSEGIVVPPHVHAVDEHVTVIRGASRWGMGETVADKTVLDTMTWRMTEGMSTTLPKLMPHYAIVEAPGGEIQIQGYGPFETYWVDTPCEPDPAMQAASNSPRKTAPASPK